MDDQRQNSKTDNDELRAITHRLVWGSDPHCSDLQGLPIKRNILSSRRVGRRLSHKIKRGRRRRVPARLKDRVRTKYILDLGLQVTHKDCHGLLNSIPENKINYLEDAPDYATLEEQWKYLDDLRAPAQSLAKKISIVGEKVYDFFSPPEGKILIVKSPEEADTNEC